MAIIIMHLNVTTKMLCKRKFSYKWKSLSQAQFCKIKYLPYFGCVKKVLQAYEVYHDIIMKTLLSFHSHFQKRLIIFSVSLVANFHFFLCQILFFQFSNFFFIDKTSSLSSKNIRDSTFKLVVNISQIP